MTCDVRLTFDMPPKQALATRIFAHHIVCMEAKTYMNQHWISIANGAEKFFQMVHGSYLRTEGPNGNVGVRGAISIEWQTVDEMRKEGKQCLAERKTSVSYLPAHLISAEKSPELFKAVTEYNPETSSVVYMWCVELQYAELRIVPRDAKLCSTSGCTSFVVATCRCTTVGYCSKVCQKAHWPLHKPACIVTVLLPSSSSSVETVSSPSSSVSSEETVLSPPPS